MSHAAVRIDELSIPAAPGAAGWDDFVAVAELRSAIEQESFGTDELNYSAEELLPAWLNQQYEPKRLFVVRAEGRVVAWASYETLPDPASEVVWLAVQVLPGWRRRGIGTALTDHVEALARTEGHRVRLVYAASRAAPGDRLDSPTGFGSVPRNNPEVHFLLARGYGLEQVERGSRLALPGDTGRIRRLGDDAAATAGPDYAVHVWSGRTPPLWREDLAHLLTRMSTDAPTAGLQEPEDPWTVERLLHEEESQSESPRSLLTAAALHTPGGRLVGFTQLSVPAEPGRSVGQEDTLVLREHRGHRLGMLLKVAALQRLSREHPGHPSITTFNAEENRPMLAVNAALGFVPMGYEGAWKRVDG